MVPIIVVTNFIVLLSGLLNLNVTMSVKNPSTLCLLKRVTILNIILIYSELKVAVYVFISMFIR